jgi:hypothetical protein
LLNPPCSPRQPVESAGGSVAVCQHKAVAQHGGQIGHGGPETRREIRAVGKAETVDISRPAEQHVGARIQNAQRRLADAGARCAAPGVSDIRYSRIAAVIGCDNGQRAAVEVGIAGVGVRLLQ